MNASLRAEYERGVRAHQNGLPDANPWGNADIGKMCAWSAGYFDSMRGMV